MRRFTSASIARGVWLLLLLGLVLEPVGVSTAAAAAAATVCSSVSPLLLWRAPLAFFPHVLLPLNVVRRFIIAFENKRGNDSEKRLLQRARERDR
jgi:membrane protein implicated in regulation of membrane protease activity